MGTRHLVAVMAGGEYRIAQYCQWDGYPSSAGTGILTFLRKVNIRELKDQCLTTRFVPHERIAEIWKSVGADDSGFVTSEVSDKLRAKYPQFSRDTGWRILPLVVKGDPGMELQNSIDFAADSLFCEFAYVVDLDKNTFEVYKGFVNEKHTGERFSEMEPSKESEYFPVRLLASFSLSSLPTGKQFLNACKCDEE
jgi:hypothetical protein